MADNPNAPTADQAQTRTLVISVVLIAILLFVISQMQEEISAFAGAVSYLHVYPFAMLVEQFPSLRTMPLIGPAFFAKAELAKLFLDQGNFAYMTSGQRLGVLTAAGLCALPVYLPFMIYAGTKGRSFRPDIVFKNAYSLEQMIWTQSEHWMTSRGARHTNPLKIPEISAGLLAHRVTEKTESRKTKNNEVGELIRLTPEVVAPAAWHRAMRPEEWLIANGLCLDEKHITAAKEKNWKYPSELLESRETWHELTLETLMETLSLQLSSPWKGFEHIRPCHKAICAVMALFYDYDISGGNVILNELGGLNDSIQGKPGGMDAAILAEEGFMQKIDKILNGPAGKQMREITDRHAWLETAFPAMLTYARKDRGVLPAAAFLWLKAEDRRLWYILDNVGSEAVMVESSGAMAHFRAENQIGKPIRRPAVYQAARALLEDYLDMTDERVIARHDKEVRGRTAGQKIDLILSSGD